MAVIKACLFDLDGTLADTLPDLAAATNDALRANGFPVRPFADFPHMVGDGVGKLIERALNDAATPERIQQVLGTFIPVYDAGCMNKTCLYDGIADLIDRLHREGIHLLVVTNKPQAQAEKIIAHFFPEGVFAGVYGGGDRYPRKPHPASVELALQQVSVTAAEAVFIGDSDVDVFTAKAAKMPCIGVSWGFRGEEELRNSGADHIAHTADDIERIVLD